MIDYTIKKSAKAKRLRITIHSNLSVIVTVPSRVSIKYAENFVKERESWIKESVEKMKEKIAKHPVSSIPKGTKQDFLKNKKDALILSEKLLLHFNKTYNLNWKKVTIKNTSTRWGSCSKRGNLNFNYRIVYLPEALAEYLIVHEICHLQEMNHSQKFWNLVEKSIPKYKGLRKELKYI